MRDNPRALQRREKLRDALIGAAERMIEAHGLAGLRARALALRVGCAVGAIYNVVTDLDDLVIAVNARTLQALERHLREAGAIGDSSAAADQVVARLTPMALAYLDFASRNIQRWRAVFDHRLAEGRELPAWYLEDQRRLFEHIEAPLRTLQPDASAEARLLMARSLFSAVHGLVLLGLEEKLQRIPLPVLREQVTLLVGALGRGLAAPA
jgi:AcrR family transcriptional regulator